MSQRPIRFVHRGEIVSVQGPAPTTSVLTWLREHQRCTGTKEGCNEGDCGACTVIVGDLDAAGALRLQPVNACIQLLPTLDGKALLTVEDLQGRHPAQQAMVACHGSQCGFCTPGFVMTLAALHQNRTMAGQGAPARGDLADELSGNLCRCTGYRPILDAGQRMFDQASPAIATEPIAAALRELRADAALQYACFHAPQSLADLAALRLALPEARLLAGGTDVALWVNKQFRELGDVIYLGRVAELQRIEVADNRLHMGAGASLTAAWEALAAHWPTLREMGRRFASPPVRNAGTLGGNVANGSPIGDGAPVLIALGAQLVLRRGEVQRSLALQDFYTGYMANQLQPGEFLQGIQVPLNEGAHALRAYKLGKRFDSDISGLAAGLWLQLEDGVVREARFAFGGMAATVRRATQAEDRVRGQPWTEATLLAAMTALDLDFQPLTDLRASASYRQRAARNLLRRFWLETRPEAPLAPHQVSVWAQAGLA
ncbi:MAG: xanthine dehydrogenase small subunit [Ideonella sp.]|nr:xanthine dehydrogenase small subunit [Ideonella sp.]